MRIGGEVTPTVTAEGGYGYIAGPLANDLTVDGARQEKSDYLSLRVDSVNRIGVRSDFQIEFPLAACAASPSPGLALRVLATPTRQPLAACHLAPAVKDAARRSDETRSRAHSRRAREGCATLDDHELQNRFACVARTQASRLTWPLSSRPEYATRFSGRGSP